MSHVQRNARVKMWSTTTEVVGPDRAPGSRAPTATVRVQATSQKRAVEILNGSRLVRGRHTVNDFRNFWSPSPPPISAPYAAEGEGIWYQLNAFPNGEYIRVWPLPGLVVE